MSDETTASIKISIDASLKDFSAKMKEFEGILKGAGEEAKKTKSSWAEMFTSMGAAQLATEAISKLKDVALESIKAFDDQVVSMARLRMSLGDGAKELEEFAKAQEKVTRYGHEEILASANLLTTHKLNTEQIKQLMPVIEDYASKTGLSLEATANSFATAIDTGMTRGLMKKFSIEIDKTGSSQEIYNELVKAGQGDVKGLAEQMGKLGSGPMIEMQHQLDTQKESIGEQLIPVWKTLAQVLQVTVIPAVQFLLGTFKVATSTLTALMAGIGAVLSGNIKGTFSEMQKAFDYAMEKQKEINKDLDIPVPGGAGKGKVNRLSTTARGHGAATEDPAIKQAQAALETFKSNVALSEAELSNLYKQNEISLEAYYESKRTYIRAVGAEELNALEEEMAHTKDVNQLKILGQTYQQKQLETQKQLVELDGEEIEAKKKLNDEQAKAAALLERIARKEDEIEEEHEGKKNPVEQLRRKQQKEMDMLNKNLFELQKLEDKKLVKHEDVEKLKTTITKREEENRKNLSRTTMEYKLQMGQQEADSLVNIFDGLNQLMGGKNKVLFELAKQASAAKVIMNTAEAVMKSWAQGGIMGPIFAISAGIAGAVQLAIVESQKPPQAGAGGLIDGALHSAGGIDINAEGGEFIQNRNAVSRYGVRAMDALNRGLVPPAALNNLVSPNTGAARAASAAVSANAPKSSHTIVNFVDPSAFKRFIETPQGKTALQNHISDNSFAVKQSLGIT